MQRRRKPRRVLVAAVLGPVLVLPMWSSPSVSTAVATQAASADTYYLDIDAVADDDVWVVGVRTTSSAPDRAVVRHWDGAAWSPAACPTGPRATASELTAVSASGPDDVWLVGDNGDLGAERTLVTHWDGTRCARVPAPSPFEQVDIVDVEAFAPDDAIVAGTALQASGRRLPLLLHWDGSRWTRLAGPVLSPATTYEVLDVTGTSADDLWLATSETARRNPTVDVSVVHHLVGGTWVATDPGPDDTRFSIAASGPGEVLAAGNLSTDQTVRAVRWTAAAGWGPVTFPTRPTTYADLVSGVDAEPAGGAWAVGTSYDARGAFPTAARWTGSFWTPASPTRPGGGEAALEGVSVLPNGHVWAAGQVSRGSGRQGIVLKRVGSAWQTVP